MKKLYVPFVALRRLLSRSRSYRLLTVVGTCFRAIRSYFGNGGASFPKVMTIMYIEFCVMQIWRTIMIYQVYIYIYMWTKIVDAN